MDQILQSHILAVIGHIQIKHRNLAFYLIFKTLHKLSGKKNFQCYRMNMKKKVVLNSILNANSIFSLPHRLLQEKIHIQIRKQLSKPNWSLKHFGQILVIPVNCYSRIKLKRYHIEKIWHSLYWHSFHVAIKLF